MVNVQMIRTDFLPVLISCQNIAGTGPVLGNHKKRRVLKSLWQTLICTYIKHFKYNAFNKIIITASFFGMAGGALTCISSCAGYCMLKKC